MKVEPDSPLAEAGHRVLMAGAAARLAPHRAAAARAVARALRRTAAGATSREERDWIERVERHRRELPRDLVRRAAPAQLGDKQAVAGAAGMCGVLSVPPVWGRFLFHLVRALSPERCLELGTGMGISGAYQAAALALNGHGTMITVDTVDHDQTAAHGFAGLGLTDRVELIVAPAGEGYARALDASGSVDFALLDADHTEDATLADFELLLPRLSAGAVVVLDDIGWTPGMRRAWGEIRTRESVAMALGMRRLGVVATRDGTPG